MTTHVRRRTASAAKSYILIAPDGTKETVINLAAYCRENNFKRSAFGNVLCGRAATHKGHRIRRA